MARAPGFRCLLGFSLFVMFFCVASPSLVFVSVFSSPLCLLLWRVFWQPLKIKACFPFNLIFHHCVCIWVQSLSTPHHLLHQMLQFMFCLFVIVVQVFRFSCTLGDCMGVEPLQADKLQTTAVTHAKFALAVSETRPNQKGDNSDSTQPPYRCTICLDTLKWWEGIILSLKNWWLEQVIAMKYNTN